MWGCCLLPVQQLLPLLSCFLRCVPLPTLLSNGNVERTQWQISREASTQVFPMCSVCFASKEECMNVWAVVFRRPPGFCFLPDFVPGFTGVLEGWCHCKSEHKLVGCYCIWKPSTVGSSPPTSKIQRNASLQPLSWLFAYLNGCWVLDVGTRECKVVLGRLIVTMRNCVIVLHSYIFIKPKQQD